MNEQRTSVETAQYNIMYDDEFKKELDISLRTRVPLIHINEKDERRFTTFINLFCILHGYELRFWDCVNGVHEEVSEYDIVPKPKEITEFLKDLAIDKTSFSRMAVDTNIGKGTIYVIKDVHLFVDNPAVYRYLHILSELESKMAILFVTPYGFSSHVGLSSIVKTIDAPLPNEGEYEQTLTAFLPGLDRSPELRKEMEDEKEVLLDAVYGMTLAQTYNYFCMKEVEKQVYKKELNKEY